MRLLWRLAPRRAPAALAIPTAAVACCASHKDSRSELGCGDLGRHRRDQRCFHLSRRHADRNCPRRLHHDSAVIYIFDQPPEVMTMTARYALLAYFAAAVAYVGY